MLEQRLVVFRLDAGEDLQEEIVLEVEDLERGSCRFCLGVPARSWRLEVDGSGGRQIARCFGGGGEE